MKVRILAFLLTLCMVVTMIPTFAFAETVTLADKVANTADNGTVTLDSDYTGDIIVGDKSLTIDLNGYSYSGWITVTGDNTITVVDSYTKDDRTSAFLGTVAGSQAKLVIKSADKIEAANLVYVATTSMATVNGDYYKVSAAPEGAKFFVANGVSFIDFTAAAAAAVSGDKIVTVPAGATVAGTVSGDITIKAEGAYEVNGLVVNNAAVSFNGGKITFKGNGISGTGKVVFKNVVLPEIVSGDTTELTVMYGAGYYPNSGPISNTSLVSEDLKWVTDYVVNAATVAIIVKANGDYVEYSDITTAVSAASTTNDSTLKLLASQSNAFFVSSGKVVLDLNGFEVDTVINSANANLTVKGGTVKNLVNTGTVTVLGGTVVVDNNGKVDVKGGAVTIKGTLEGVTIYYAEGASVDNKTSETFERKNFDVYVGLDDDGNVIAYAAIVNDKDGFLTVQKAFDAAKDGDTVMIYAKGVVGLTVNTKIIIKGETIGDVTITAKGSITTEWGEKYVTYGPDVYENIGTPICYVTTADGEADDRYFMDLQGAVDYIEGLTSKKGTVVLLADHTGKGVYVGKLATGVDITIDLGGHTYTFNKGVGSSDETMSNGFQLLKGNTVTIQNGTLKADVVKEGTEKEVGLYILIQNYADLTIKDVNLDGTNLDKWSRTDGDSYVVSNNSGNVLITGKTSITANDEGDKAFAFDVCKYESYDAPTVTIDTTGTITGKFEVSTGTEAKLNVKNGNFVNIPYADLYPYIDADNSRLVADKETGSIGVVTGDELPAYVAQIGDIKYIDLKTALADAANSTGKVTVTLLANAKDVVIPEGTATSVTIKGGEFVIENITKNNTGTLSISSGTVKGAIVVNAGTLSISGKTAYYETELVDADGAEKKARITITGGKWYGIEASDILPYVGNTRYVVVEAEDETGAHLTVQAIKPQASVMLEGEELFRFAEIDAAIEYALGLKNGAYVQVLDSTIGTTVDLTAGQTLVIKGGIEDKFVTTQEDDYFTVVETAEDGTMTFTGYESHAKVVDKYFSTVGDAVEYAISKDLAVTVLTEGMEDEFVVGETQAVKVTVEGKDTILGYGSYAVNTFAEDCEASITVTVDKVKVTTYYETVENALAVAVASTKALTVNVIKAVTIDSLTVELKDVNVTINGNSNLEIKELAVTGTAKSFTISGTTLTTVNVTESAKVTIKACGDITTVTVTEGAAVTINGTTNIGTLEVIGGSATISGKLTTPVVVSALRLDGTVTLTISGVTEVKSVTATDVEFYKGGISGGTYSDYFDALVPNLKSGYVFNKRLDGEGDEYYEAVDSEAFVVLVDGIYYTDVDVQYAVDLAANPENILLDITFVKKPTAPVYVGLGYKLYIVDTDAENIPDFKTNKLSIVKLVEVEGEKSYYTSVRYYATVEIAGDMNYFTGATAAQDAINFAASNSGASVVTLYTEADVVVNGKADAEITILTNNNIAIEVKTGAVVVTPNTVWDAIKVNGVAKDASLTVTQGSVLITDGALEEMKVEGTINVVPAFRETFGSYYVYWTSLDKVFDEFTWGTITLIKDFTIDELNYDVTIDPNGYTLTINELNAVATIIGKGLVDVNAINTNASVVINSVDVHFTDDLGGKWSIGLENPETYYLGEVVTETTTYYALLDAVASYDGKGYPTLDAAITAAAGNTEKAIKLYADANYTTDLTLQNVNIDLNGFTLSAKTINIKTKTDVTLSNGDVVTNGTAKDKAYVIAVATGATLTLNNVKVGSGVAFDVYTGKQVAITLDQDSTLAGKDIYLVNVDKNGDYVSGGVLVNADPGSKNYKPAVLDVEKEIDFAKAIFYKYTNGKIDCRNHIMTEGHTHMCQFCGENAVKVIVTDAEIVEIIGQHGTTTIDRCVTDGNYYVFSGTTITIKHGAVPAGKHFAGWNIAGNVTDEDGNSVLTNSKANSYIVYSEVTNAGVSIAPNYVDNDEVEVKIYGTNFIVEGAMDTAQYGNYIGSFRVGDVITITYNPDEIAGFGKLVYWVNDNNTVIGTDNTIEYTVPANGGTVTAIVDYAAANSVYVVFQNGATATGAKVLSSQYYAVKDGAVKVNAPALPALGNKNVLGWKIEGTDTVVEDLNAAIYAAYADGKTQVTLVPAIGETDKVEITVDGNAMMVDPSVFTTIEAPEAPEGKVFSHWEINGNVVPVAKLTWKFNKGDVVVSKFANEDDVTFVDAFASLTNDNAVAGDKVIFSAVFKLLGEGYEMLDAGIVYSTSVSDEKLLVPSSTDPNVKVKHIENLADFATVTYTLTLNFKGGQKKDVWAVAYVNYKDADGVSKVVYSPLSVYDVIPQD